MTHDWLTHRGFGGPPASKGTVHLVGAGPGDVGLLTLRAATLLSTCDLAAYDRLAPAAALDLMPADAERICVGKRSGEAGMSRAEVDQLLQSRALGGAAVVRLKGGDPFVFGRGGEEALACARAGVPVEVVHGISAPIAVPGAAGIPVTHRGLAAGFAVVTGHEAPDKRDPQVDLAHLAGFPGTLLFLMAVDNLGGIVDALREHGRAPDTPVALVQWGTTARQRSLVGTLATIVDEARGSGIGSPAVVVVGEVVGLAADISRREGRPLHGVGVLVPRSTTRPSRVAALLRAAGADVQEIVVARTERVDADGVAKVVAGLRDDAHGTVALTSSEAARMLREALAAAGADSRALAGTKVVAVGRSVARAVRDVLAVEPDATVAHLDELPAGADVVVLRRADEAVPTPARSVVATRTVPLSPPADWPEGAPARLVAVGSSTLVPLLDAWVAPDAAHVAMGPTTCDALVAAGRQVAGIASKPSTDAMVAALVAAAAPQAAT